jgi:uncharacterized membrane protein YphA (DoxX/SURF4 family)
MIKPRLENHLYLLFRVILGGTFIFASYSKILDPEGFARIVSNYRILPEIFINPFALVLPWIELFCGILLIGGYLIKGSVSTINLMMLVFTVAISVNMIRGVDITCGCFSTTLTASKQAFSYLIRDIILLCMGVWIFYHRVKREKISALSRVQ